MMIEVRAPKPEAPEDPDRYLRMGAILKRYGISRTTWHRWTTRGAAPRPVRLGGSGAVFWKLRDLIDWEQRCAAASGVEGGK